MQLSCGSEKKKRDRKMMKKWRENRIYILLIIMISSALLFYYVRNISGVKELNELVDSFGYLSNAAYFSGTKWVHAINLYYGYGYSLWLIPLFWIYDTGIAIIHRALLINVMFIVGIFLTLVWILRRFFAESNKYIHLVIAGALCLYPSLMKASLTVWCESLLPFVVLLCAIFAYQAIEKQKTLYFILLGIMTPYVFFIHARSVVFLAIFLGMFVVASLVNKIPMRRLAVLVVTGIIVFALGYYVKHLLIQEVYTSELRSYLLNEVSGEDNVGNLLSISGIVDAFKVSISNSFVKFVYAFFCKVFYLFIGTAGMFWVGVVYGIRSLEHAIKNRAGVSGKTFVMSSFAIASLVMLVAVTVNCSSYESDVRYYFYGRYYEFLVFLPTATGVAHLVEKRNHLWKFLGSAVLGIASFGIVYGLRNLVSPEKCVFDSCRWAAFSYGLVNINDYGTMLKYYFAAALIGFCIAIVLNRSKYVRWLIPLVLLLNPIINNQVIADRLIEDDESGAYEQEIAEYIFVNNSEATVYFANDEEGYYTIVYTGLQGVLGTKELHVIAERDADRMEKGSLVIARWGNTLEEKRSDLILLLRTDRYYLYYIE
jgi:hypothetical protein